METLFIALRLVVITTPAFAQIATPIFPAATPGPPPTGSFTMSGCVSAPVPGSGLVTMIGPTITPTAIRGNLPPAPPPRVGPLVVAPLDVEPAYGPGYDLPPVVANAPPRGEAGAVGTVGTTMGGAVGALGAERVTPEAIGPPLGYRLTGSDMSAWIGRRVRVLGTMSLIPPQFVPGTVDPENPAAFPAFNVLSVVPMTGACPQP